MDEEEEHILRVPAGMPRPRNSRHRHRTDATAVRRRHESPSWRRSRRLRRGETLDAGNGDRSSGAIPSGSHLLSALQRASALEQLSYIGRPEQPCRLFRVATGAAVPPLPSRDRSSRAASPGQRAAHWRGRGGLGWWRTWAMIGGRTGTLRRARCGRGSACAVRGPWAGGRAGGRGDAVSVYPGPSAGPARPVCGGATRPTLRAWDGASGGHARSVPPRRPCDAQGG